LVFLLCQNNWNYSIPLAEEGTASALMDFPEATTRNIAATSSGAYAPRMSNDSKPQGHLREGHMRLIALLMYVAKQKQKSQVTVERLFRRLMLPRRH
jgi:hypothetical protein